MSKCVVFILFLGPERFHSYFICTTRRKYVILFHFETTKMLGQGGGGLQFVGHRSDTKEVIGMTKKIYRGIQFF